MKKRHYRMSERAKSQEETRQRIVEATMHLHEEVGPRATTISAIAEKAGVQRLTVYRHFPDETAVFQACTSHWLSLNPPPNPTAWNSIASPYGRVRTALAAFFGYYSSTRRMWTVSHRDVADVPALQEPMTEFAGFVAKIGGDFAAMFDLEGERARLVGVTIRHALSFPAWSDLEGQGLSDVEKVDLVTQWVAGLAPATLPESIGAKNR